MEVYTEYISWDPYKSKRFNEYFDGLKLMVIDIETTGLYADSSRLILGGAAVLKESDILIKQFFLENKDDEVNLLQEYSNLLEEADVIITYNGNSFDLPFLRQRLNYFGLKAEPETFQKFDLYRALNIYSSFRDALPDLKQKTVEAYLGISSGRTDVITGRESIDLYREYTREKSQEKKQLILLHNRDDLYQLASVLQIIDKLDLHKILYHEGFTIAFKDRRVFIRKISLNSRALKVTASTKNIPIDYYSFDFGYQLVHNAAAHKLTLELPIEKDKGVIFLDLVTMPFDFSELQELPCYKHGYLVLFEHDQIHHSCINKLIKIIFREIMQKF